jgi:GTP-binding protein
MPLSPQTQLRNVAIIAHVDHGKTTLVDAMLSFSHVLEENRITGELIMDTDPQERERGITILAKNTAIAFAGVTVNIIDTPGHADFSGEVERVVNMADGCLLVVDAVEGPMPQTRYVLKTALTNGLRPVVVVNKIDRPNARCPEVVSEVQDLFLELATDAEQLDFPVLYASAKGGYALNELGDELDEEQADMEPLFRAIIDHIPPPMADPDGALQMLVTSLGHDDHLGQISIGRIFRGELSRGMTLALVGMDGPVGGFKADHLYTFRNLSRNEVDSAVAGDIVAVAGLRGVTIGDTIAAADAPEALDRIAVEQPTVKMTFGVNTSPFSGKDGKYATSRMLWARLQKELETNVSLRVERTDRADEFVVSGRGELHLSVLIESIRREGLELQVSKPEAVTTLIDGKLHEPYELLTIDTTDEFIGVITEELSARLARMADMSTPETGRVRLRFELPTRGLIGFRSFFLRVARGTGVMNSELLEMRPVTGVVKSTRAGSLVASHTGTVVSNGLRNAQGRGRTFVEPSIAVYEGMVVGVGTRKDDMDVNVCKQRKLTNMRSSTSDIVVRLEPPMRFSLEEALNFIADDELLEVTPTDLRMRKSILDSGARQRGARDKAPVPVRT